MDSEAEERDDILETPEPLESCVLECDCGRSYYFDKNDMSPSFWDICDLCIIELSRDSD